MDFTKILKNVLLVITSVWCSTGNLSADEFDGSEFEYFRNIDQFSGETEPFVSTDIEPFDVNGDFSESHSEYWTEDTTIYLSANNYLSFNHLESGGFNTNFLVPNTGTDSNVSYDFGLALGARIPFCCKAVRIEVEGAFRDLGELMTDSMQPETSSILYQVDYSDRWSVMTNFWFDIPIHETKTIYFGGGIGANGGRLSVNDGNIGGQGRFSEFAWQIGGGITWERNDRWTVDIGYRYIDYGSAAVALSFNSNGFPSGNYTADLTAHQLMIGFRYSSLGNLFARK